MNNSICVKFLPPFNIFTGVKEAEIELQKNITLGEFQQLLIEKYPKIKESNIQLEHIYYIINNQPPRKDKSLVIKSGDEIKLYSPTLAG